MTEVENQRDELLKALGYVHDAPLSVRMNAALAYIHVLKRLSSDDYIAERVAATVVLFSDKRHQENCACLAKYADRCDCVLSLIS